MKTYDTKALCKLLNSHRSTIWRKVREGLLPKPKKLGRKSLWLAEEVENAIANLPQA